MVNFQTTHSIWGELPDFPFPFLDMTPVLVGDTLVAQGMAEEMNHQANLAALEREAMRMNIQLNLKPRAKDKDEKDKDESEKKKIEKEIKEGRLPFYVVNDGRTRAGLQKADLERLEQLAEQGN